MSDAIELEEQRRKREERRRERDELVREAGIMINNWVKASCPRRWPVFPMRNRKS